MARTSRQSTSLQKPTKIRSAPACSNTKVQVMMPKRFQICGTAPELTVQTRSHAHYLHLPDNAPIYFACHKQRWHLHETQAGSLWSQQAAAARAFSLTSLVWGISCGSHVMLSRSQCTISGMHIHSPELHTSALSCTRFNNPSCSRE